MAQEDNWLCSWLKGGGQKKHQQFKDEGDERGKLFGEINDLRKPDPNARANADDEDAREKAKYKDDFFGTIAKSKAFEFATLGMISANALAIGVDADYSARFGKPDNLNDGPIGFIIVEWTFAIYFTSEVIIRFLAYKNKTDCLCDAWFVFDSVLVTMMVIETWVLPFVGSSGPLSQLSILRLLRLLRITRMARLMRAVPEMMVIIKGMVASTRTVLITGALLVLVLYTFCILFTDAYHERKHPDGEDPLETEAMFGTMGKSMFSLFIYATILDDVTYASDAIRESKNHWMMVAFVVFILISSFMMLNMLIGVLVEVVGATAECERATNIEDKVREAIGNIFATMDDNKNNVIDREEFMKMSDSEEVMAALSELDINQTHFELYAELLFKPDKKTKKTESLNYDKLVSMILRLRPGSFVSALDFAAFSKTITGIHDRIRDRAVHLEKICTNLVGDPTGEASLAQLTSDSGLPALNGAPPARPPGEASHLTDMKIDKPKAPGLNDVVLPFTSDPNRPGTLAPLGSLSALSGLSEADRERLERTADVDIIEELQRRLGMADLDKVGVPYSMMDEELQSKVRAAAERGAHEAQPLPGYIPQALPDNAEEYAEETVYV